MLRLSPWLAGSSPSWRNSSALQLLLLIWPWGGTLGIFWAFEQWSLIAPVANIELVNLQLWMEFPSLPIPEISDLYPTLQNHSKTVELLYILWRLGFYNFCKIFLVYRHLLDAAALHGVGNCSNCRWIPKTPFIWSRSTRKSLTFLRKSWLIMTYESILSSGWYLVSTQ